MAVIALRSTARRAIALHPALSVVAVAIGGGYVWCALSLLAARLARHMALVDTAFVPSDFFVPWLGAKALISGRSPYTIAFAEQLHRIFYGAVISPSSEMQNVAAFAYPPFIVALLLPFLWLPFEVVRWLAVAALAACVAGSAVLWLRLVRPGSSATALVAAAAASLAFMPTLELLWLQQVTGFMLVILAGTYALAARGRHWPAGLLLALGVTKFQLVALPTVALLAWAATRRERWGLAAGFALGIGALLALSESLLPGWPAEFIAAMERYRAANTIYWLPSKLAGSVGGAALSLALLGGFAASWWASRNRPLSDVRVAHLFALACACGVVLTPDVSFYNRALLVLPIVSIASAGVGARALRRATSRAALAAIAAPVLFMGVAAPAGAAGAPDDFVQALISGSEAALLLLPLMLLPALWSLAAERGHDVAAFRPRASLPRPISLRHTRVNVRPVVLVRAFAVTAGIALLAGYVHLVADASLARIAETVAKNGGTFVPSDLYQPWAGAWALLSGINPYSAEFSSQLHETFYGVPFSPGHGGNAAIQFFYPPFVVVPMALFLPLPFEAARWIAVGGFAVALGAAGWLWAGAHGARRSHCLAAALFAVLLPASQELLWLQQLSGLVIFFLVAAYAAAVRRRFALAGLLIALTIFKPQLMAIPAAPLLFWSLWQRSRWSLIIAFLAAAAAQFALAELLLPGWIVPFLEIVRHYQAVNAVTWFPSLVLQSDAAGLAASGALVGIVAWVWWRQRFAEAGSGPWLAAAALAFVSRALLMPDISYYNQSLLLVPIISIACWTSARTLAQRLARKLALCIALAPICVAGAVGVARWIGAEGAGAETALHVMEAVTLGLPLFLLPAALSLVAHHDSGISLTSWAHRRSKPRRSDRKPAGSSNTADDSPLPGAPVVALR